jgi:hypothetical protein
MSTADVATALLFGPSDPTCVFGLENGKAPFPGPYEGGAYRDRTGDLRLANSVRGLAVGPHWSRFVADCGFTPTWPRRRSPPLAARAFHERSRMTSREMLLPRAPRCRVLIPRGSSVRHPTVRTPSRLSRSRREASTAEISHADNEAVGVGAVEARGLWGGSLACRGASRPQRSCGASRASETSSCRGRT